MDGDKLSFPPASLRYDNDLKEFKIKGAAQQATAPRILDAQNDIESFQDFSSGNSVGLVAGNISSHQSKARELKPVEDCTICLEPISERAVASPCNHLTFDFICLVSWLQDNPICPLCKVEVAEVQYDWRSPEDYKSYDVSRKRPQQTWTNANRSCPHPRSRPTPRRNPQTNLLSSFLPSPDESLAHRRRVYRNRTPSLYVGANRISQYRDFTSETFSRSAELQRRARAFLRRELLVFSFLDGDSSRSSRGNSREFLVEYVIAVLRTKDLKSANGEAENLIAELLGRENGRLLLHELEAWLRSPYISIDTWDRHVQYAQQ